MLRLYILNNIHEKIMWVWLAENECIFYIAQMQSCNANYKSRTFCKFFFLLTFCNVFFMQIINK